VPVAISPAILRIQSAAIFLSFRAQQASQDHRIVKRMATSCQAPDTPCSQPDTVAIPAGNCGVTRFHVSYLLLYEGVNVCKVVDDLLISIPFTTSACPLDAFTVDVVPFRMQDVVQKHRQLLEHHCPTGYGIGPITVCVPRDDHARKYKVVPQPDVVWWLQPEHCWDGMLRFCAEDRTDYYVLRDHKKRRTLHVKGSDGKPKVLSDVFNTFVCLVTLNPVLS
jgi:hypothetical protein